MAWEGLKSSSAFGQPSGRMLIVVADIGAHGKRAAESMQPEFSDATISSS
jgi:hypothetical protein